MIEPMAGRARRGHGGSIRRLPSGRWQVRLHDRGTGAYTALGVFDTKAGADAALAAAKTDMGRGGFVSPDRGRLPLRQYADGWVQDHSGLSRRTRDLYGSLLRLHILPILGDIRIGDIDPSTVRRWYAGMTTGRPTKARTYRLVHAILETAVKDELIVRNPCRIAGAGQEKAVERPTATIPQTFALAEAMQPPLRCLPLVAAFGQLRLGECAGLRRRDVDPLHGGVHVRQQVQRLDDGTIIMTTPKNDSQRFVTLPEQIMEELTAHLAAYVAEDPAALLFTKPNRRPLDRNWVNKEWRKARRVVADHDATFPAELHFHDLRGTGATLATAQGATLREVMARLGHRTTRAAMIYQHATADRDVTIARLLGDAIDTARRADVVDLDEVTTRRR